MAMALARPFPNIISHLFRYINIAVYCAIQLYCFLLCISALPSQDDPKTTALWALIDLSKNCESSMSYPSVMTTLIQNRRLRLLNALRAGSKPIMTFLGLPSFRTAQVVAQTGVDVSIYSIP